MSKFTLPPPKWHTWRRKGRLKKLIDDEVIPALEKTIHQDAHYVKCFAKTSPSLQELLKDGVDSISRDELLEEARTLHESLGSSEIVKSPDKPDESKYKEYFSFEPQFWPLDADEAAEEARQEMGRNRDPAVWGPIVNKKLVRTTGEPIEFSKDADRENALQTLKERVGAQAMDRDRICIPSVPPEGWVPTSPV